MKKAILILFLSGFALAQACGGGSSDNSGSSPGPATLIVGKWEGDSYDGIPYICSVFKFLTIAFNADNSWVTTAILADDFTCAGSGTYYVADNVLVVSTTDNTCRGHVTFGDGSISFSDNNDTMTIITPAVQVLKRIG